MGIDRRRVIGLGAGLATGMAAMHAHGAAARDATPAATPAATPVGGVDPVTGEWSFTDDKGVTVTLPRRPERLAIDLNAAAPLWDYGIRPVAVFGWNVGIDGTFNDAGGDVDPAAVELIGDVDERFRVEDAVAVEPDLLITITFDDDDPGDYWSFDPDVLTQIQGRFPLIALSASRSAGEGVERFAELAAALGADLSAPDLVAAKDAHTAKVAEVRSAIAAAPDLTVLFAYLSGTELYLASAPDWGDLSYYASLGLRIEAVGADPGTYWTRISAEEIGGYPADALFRSTRPGTLTPAELAADAVFSLHPAVAAGQIFDWNQDVILSYPGLTAALDVILDGVRSSRKVT